MKSVNFIFLDALNARAELAQLRVHAFVAAVQMVNAVDLRRAFGRQPAITSADARANRWPSPARRSMACRP